MRLATLLASVFAVTVFAQSSFAQRTAKVLIVLVGDSTTAPQNGWGPGFAECLKGDVQCIDRAVNGRSTKSFIDEGKWQQALDLKPDYIFIQFGHNDQKKEDPTRYAEPNTAFKDNLTKFVNESRAIGAKPVLITSVSRRRWQADGKSHSDLFDYVNPVKELAPQLKVPLIDLHAMSIELYDKLGKAEVDKLSKDYVDATTRPAGFTAPPIDNTHFNHDGALVIGKLVADQVKKTIPELAQYIK